MSLLCSELPHGFSHSGRPADPAPVASLTSFVSYYLSLSCSLCSCHSGDHLRDSVLTVPSPWTVLPQKLHDLLPFFLLGKDFLATLANISILALLCPYTSYSTPQLFFSYLLSFKINMLFVLLIVSPPLKYTFQESQIFSFIVHRCIPSTQNIAWHIVVAR